MTIIDFFLPFTNQIIDEDENLKRRRENYIFLEEWWVMNSSKLAWA